MDTRNRIAVLAAAYAVSMAAGAQAGFETDPALGTYANIYTTLNTVHSAAAGKAEMVIRVMSAASLQPLPDLAIALRGTSTQDALTLSPDGFLAVPLSEKYLADRAVFVTNKKGLLRVEDYFVPVLPQATLTYADIAASIAAGRRASSAVLPWYLRAFTGDMQAIQFCYPAQGRRILIDAGAGAGADAGATRPAAIAQKNPLSKQVVYCAAFTARETAAAPATRITPPPGWVALFH